MAEPTNINRYVTGHDENGHAIFSFEGSVPYTKVLEKSGKNALFGVPWKTDSFPSECNGKEDAAVIGGPLHNDEGTLCRVVEFPPNTSSPFHRTCSLDYGILVSGEMHLELDDGHTRKFVQGDVAVQRGTMHAWHNRTNEYARMIFVLVAAKPTVINGKVLEDAMIRDTPLYEDGSY